MRGRFGSQTLSHPRAAFDQNSNCPGNSLPTGSDRMQCGRGWRAIVGHPGASFASRSPAPCNPNVEFAPGLPLFSDRLAFLSQQPFVEFWNVVRFRP